MDDARTAGTGPAYLKVAEDLRLRILRGDLEPGTVLPDEQSLADAYGFSTSIIRSALLQLQEWRLVASGRVLRPPKALFDGIGLGDSDPRHAVVGELLALDPRYVLVPPGGDDHLRLLIRKDRIPIITGPAPDPARWLTVLLRPSHEKAVLAAQTGCTIVIRTDLTAPPDAARALHAMVMA